MVDAGQIALPIALLTAVYAAVASFGAAWRRIPELAVSGRYAFYAVPPAACGGVRRAGVRLREQRLRRALRRRKQQPRHAPRLHLGRLLRGQRRLAAVPGSGVLGHSHRRRAQHTASAALHRALRHRHNGAGAGVLPGHHRILRQPARAAEHRPARRTGHQPVARPLRDVHTPAHADDGSCGGGDTVQHSDGRAAGAARRARRMGGPGPRMGDGVVAHPDVRAAAR